MLRAASDVAVAPNIGADLDGVVAGAALQDGWKPQGGGINHDVAVARRVAAVFDADGLRPGVELAGINRDLGIPPHGPHAEHADAVDATPVPPLQGLLIDLHAVDYLVGSAEVDVAVTQEHQGVGAVALDGVAAEI